MEKLEIIKKIKDSYCQEHLGIPYMLLGDVFELIESLTGEKITFNDLKLNTMTKTDEFEGTLDNPHENYQRLRTGIFLGRKKWLDI